VKSLLDFRQQRKGVVKMKSTKIKIFCSNCENWFASPLDLADECASDTSILEGNKFTCQNCRQLVICDTRNMCLSVDFENGNRTAPLNNIIQEEHYQGKGSGALY
jgi:hypothetical protein